MDIGSGHDLSYAHVLIDTMGFVSINSWVGFSLKDKIYDVHVREAMGMISTVNRIDGEERSRHALNKDVAYQSIAKACRVEGETSKRNEVLNSPRAELELQLIHSMTRNDQGDCSPTNNKYEPTNDLEYNYVRTPMDGLLRANNEAECNSIRPGRQSHLLKQVNGDEGEMGYVEPESSGLKIPPGFQGWVGMNGTSS